MVSLPGAAERLAWLATWLPRFPGSGIVYCLTKRDTETVAEWLVTRGIDAVAYSGEVTQAPSGPLHRLSRAACPV